MDEAPVGGQKHRPSTDSVQKQSVRLSNPKHCFNKDDDRSNRQEPGGANPSGVASSLLAVQPPQHCSNLQVRRGCLLDDKYAWPGSHASDIATVIFPAGWIDLLL